MYFYIKKNKELAIIPCDDLGVYRCYYKKMKELAKITCMTLGVNAQVLL
jgi:hypothetical protein